MCAISVTKFHFDKKLTIYIFIFLKVPPQSMPGMSPYPKQQPPSYCNSPYPSGQSPYPQNTSPYPPQSFGQPSPYPTQFQSGFGFNAPTHMPMPGNQGPQMPQPSGGPQMPSSMSAPPMGGAYMGSAPPSGGQAPPTMGYGPPPMGSATPPMPHMGSIPSSMGSAPPMGSLPPSMGSAPPSMPPMGSSMPGMGSSMPPMPSGGQAPPTMGYGPPPTGSAPPFGGSSSPYGQVPSFGAAPSPANPYKPNYPDLSVQSSRYGGLGSAPPVHGHGTHQSYKPKVRISIFHLFFLIVCNLTRV